MTIGHVLRKSFLSTLIRSRWIKKQSYSSATATMKFPYKVDNSLLGYSIKEVESVPELNLTAVLLKHGATGAEHLHLASADTNNLFAVAFRTPPPDSSGVSHILEHLSLCGSRNFPCRDPFFNMLNRSLSTFMNAFTGSDSTVYAFSTQNSKDFQNLLSVYLDATFYPLLNEKDFRQEGWRLEHEDIYNKNSPIVLKGVVFNEMKGVFSDSSQYYARHLKNYLFPSNAYSHESGGDPLAIPNLTWQGLKHFHSTLYHPSNSRFITYGNMPLEVHLEKISNHVLQNFKKTTIESEVPDVEAWVKPKEVVIFNRFDRMVANIEKQTVISESYVLNRITDTYENFALSILGTLLIDGPNSPFYQNLLQAGIGPDYSPCTGFDSSIKQSVFSVGLREIAEKDVDLVKNLISSTFKHVINEGFPEKQIESVLHKIELATKHRTIDFGLNCALGVNSMWNHNGHPISSFKMNDHVKWFLNQMKENPHFLQDKVVQYFQNNPHKLTLIMKPDKYFDVREHEKQKELLNSKVSKLSDVEREQIYQQGLELAEHQKQVDASCLPTLQIDDVKKSIEKAPLQFISLRNGKIPLQICEQPTNEITYFKALIDASGLSEEDVMLLPLLTSLVTQMGAGKFNYKELDQEIQLKTGKMHVSLHLSENPSTPQQFKQALYLSSYCLDKNIESMFSLWKDIITNVRLEDGERLTQLIQLYATEMSQGIIYNGHHYSLRKANSSLSHCAHLKEITSGLSQFTFMKRLAEMQSHEEILERLKKLANVLFNRTPIKCSLNVTPNFMESAVSSLDSFLHQLPFSETSFNYQKTHYESKNQKTHFVLDSLVNYLGQSILTVPYCDPHFASLKVAAKLMSSKFLHSEIREKGGAYGGGASINKEGHFMFHSYRDPNITKTLKSFSSGIEWLLEGSYSDLDITEAKLGVFSKVDAPINPGSKGSAFFLEDVSYEMKEQMRNNIFCCTRNDLMDATQKYLKNSEKVGTALIGPENTVTRSGDTNWNIETNDM